MRSVTCCTVSSVVAPGHSVFTTMVLMVNGGSSSRPSLPYCDDAGERDDQHEVDDEALVLERPPGQVEILHLLVLPFADGLGKAHLLTFAQRVDAGGDDDVSLGEPVGDDGGVGLVAGDGDRSQRDAAGGLIERPRRRASRSSRRELRGGASPPDPELRLQATGDAHAEAQLRRRILERYFDRVGACRGVGDGRDLAYDALDLQLRVGQRPDDDFGMLAARVVIRESGLGDVEDGVLVARPGELHHHLAGVARSGPLRRRRR